MSRARRARPPLILVASDREPSASEIERILGHHGYTVFRAHTGRLALAAARSTQPDAILLDQTLPQADGFELCSTLRDDAEVGAGTPLLMLTPKRPTPYAHRAALRAGVWEFLPQPMHPEELRARVDTYVLLATAPPETAAGHGAERDPESGLYGPAAFARRARELALQAFHHHGAMACVRLAPTREADGPRVARYLSARGRRSDAIGRLAPGEFAIVAPGTDARGAVLLAERIARELGSPTGDETAAPPELRAGFDAIPDVRRTRLTPGNLLNRAAQALSRAQAPGRGDWIRAYD